MRLAGLGEQARGLAAATVGDEDVGLAQLRRQVVGAGADQRVFAQGARRILALFLDAAQVEVRGVDVAVALDQFAQVALGFVPVLVFQADQGQRVTQLVVFGVLLDQAEEFTLGVTDAVLFDQGARVGQAQALVVRVVTDGPT
ncbi:hypothetical protein D3C76_990140 [compost metagenome]